MVGPTSLGFRRVHGLMPRESRIRNAININARNARLYAARPGPTFQPFYPNDAASIKPNEIDRLPRPKEDHIFGSNAGAQSKVLQWKAPRVVPKENSSKVSTNIPNIWLRDNCQCTACVHPDTKQRLIDTFKIPADIEILSQRVHEDEGVHVNWSDGHESYYPASLLNSATDVLSRRKAWAKDPAPSDQPHYWGAEIKDNRPEVAHSDLSKGDNIVLKDVLGKIRKYGFCFVTGVPHENGEATQQFLEKIAFIRQTHYGGFYDFTADLSSKDTAYTNIALEAHTDTTYFSDPAGLQAFHLLSHTDGEGGASLLVDGFKVAQELAAQDMEAYNILSKINVVGHASGNEGISIQPYKGFPVIEASSGGKLARVRWNSSDRAGVEMTIRQVKRWYDAARKFDALLKKSQNEYWEQLKPGELLIFDNWRVMHGRSAFTGKRRICGAYINRDDWISKYRMLQFGPEEVLARIPAR